MNKYVRKVLSIASILTMIFVFKTTPSLASTDFTDISNSYAKDAINELVEAGIINGVGNGQFNPTGKIARQDFAIILAKALNLDIDEAPANPTFSDVPPSHYSYKYIEAAAEAELISGIGGGNFGLGANLSRQDMAVLFVRALGADTAGLGENLTFSDANQISGYAKDAVGFAVEAGLLAGVGNNSFNPTGNAERQAVALVATKFLKVKEEISNPQPRPEPTPEPTPEPVPEPEPTPNPGTIPGTNPGSNDPNQGETPPVNEGIPEDEHPVDDETPGGEGPPVEEP